MTSAIMSRTAKASEEMSSLAAALSSGFSANTSAAPPL
jgi:hypothetical protein